MLGLLVIGGFSLAYYIQPVFAMILAAYFGMNLAYSFSLKHVALVDVMLIALGFVLRVEGGGAVIDVFVSAWIVIMTGLFALFMALAKRRDDLIKALDGDHRRSLDGYTLPFLDVVITIITSALLVAYLVYTTDQDVMERVGSDKLFYTAPFVVIGILRYTQITIVEQRSGSPTRIALTDRFIILTVSGWLLTFAALIYL